MKGHTVDFASFWRGCRSRRPSLPCRNSGSQKRQITALAVTTVFMLSLAQPSALATTAPTVTPGSGTYSDRKTSVTISGAPGDSLYYTTTGATPTSGSTPYTTAISIGSTATIKAVAYNGGTPSTVTTAYIQSDGTTLPVPRTGLKLWLKSDFGPIVSSSKITNWLDMSGNSPANDATQSTSADQATFVSSSINGYPGASFDGSSDFYNLTNSLTDLTTGFSIFAVIKPGSSSTKTLYASANSGPADLVSLETVNTQARFDAYNNTTSSNVITPSASLTVDKYQLVDAVHDGAGNAVVSINGTAQQSGTVQNLRNQSRSANILGADYNTSSFWNGELAELLVYSRALTEAERKDVQAYLFTRYQLATSTIASTPVLSVATSTMTAPSQVAIYSREGGEIRLTRDGSTPNSSSELYSGPILITYSQTIKAISISNGITSSVASATYTLNSTHYPAPDPSDSRPLELNLQLPTTAIPQ